MAAGDDSHRPALRLQGIRKSYGQVVAVAGIDLEVAEGEFFTLLGPSGSGKTTLLRLIAGFERPDPAASSSAATTSHLCRPTCATPTPCSRTTRSFRTCP